MLENVSNENEENVNFLLSYTIDNQERLSIELETCGILKKRGEKGNKEINRKKRKKKGSKKEVKREANGK